MLEFISTLDTDKSYCHKTVDMPKDLFSGFLGKCVEEEEIV